MAGSEAWAAIVASTLDWEQAHVTFDAAVAHLAPDLRGKLVDHFPHSAWQLVEHIRRSQHDLLDFCRNPEYKELKWPDDYWPTEPAPPSEKAWTDSLAAIRRDRDEFAKFTREHHDILTEKIPHGTGQTYLRTVLVTVDHTAYHVGQIAMLRQLLGAWPPA